MARGRRRLDRAGRVAVDEGLQPIDALVDGGERIAAALFGRIDRMAQVGEIDLVRGGREMSAFAAAGKFIGTDFRSQRVDLFLEEAERGGEPRDGGRLALLLGDNGGVATEAAMCSPLRMRLTVAAPSVPPIATETTSATAIMSVGTARWGEALCGEAPGRRARDKDFSSIRIYSTRHCPLIAPHAFRFANADLPTPFGRAIMAH